MRTVIQWRRRQFQHFDDSQRQDSITIRTVIRPTLPAHISDAIASRLSVREINLSPYAVRAETSAGRDRPEAPSPTRSEFQRDRDRILHTKSFRRLKHKTQVFIVPLGDHYATRLTHTLEVSQIARTIARALNLNEDLTEAISLGHDLGHTPFGHVGEYAMDELHPGGFRHSRQSLRIVEQLEKDGNGLNLMWEVRDGILNHSKPRGEFLGRLSVEGLSLEGQICRISDAVAYLNHDLADSFRAGILTPETLPLEVSEVLGETHAQRINSMVSDIVATSWDAVGETDSAGTPVIGMGEEVRGAFYALREFMFDNVYLPESNGVLGKTAEDIMSLLYSHFSANRSEIPPEYAQRSKSEDMAVVDYISGMTDYYAIRVAERIMPGIAAPFTERRVI